MKRLLSAVLSAALLISLCACNPHEMSESDAPFWASRRPAHSSDSSEAPAESSASPDPEASPPPEYDQSHRLDVPIPALINGLEMPVVGATGYASVELPLWPEIPGETEDPEPTDSSEPEPGSSEPAADSSPEPGSPDETGEPDPAESAQPDPAGSQEPTQELPTEAAGMGRSSAPEGTGSPEPTDAPPLVTLIPPDDPSPAEEQTPEPEPEPEPTEPSDPYEDALVVLEPGEAFVILEEDGDWWRVSRGEEVGWIEHRYCMINLPDVIPSIIYNDTNSYRSIFVSCGKEIPGITGVGLYGDNYTWTYNVRLERQEYIMPMLYAAARNICAAQHRALAQGNCLVVYQTFRPADTQTAVAKALSELAKYDTEVREGISTPPWSITWFISTGVSNHQRGYALDVSMVKVYEAETRYIGRYPYLRMTDYEDYQMPTAMHELSKAAATTISPTSSRLTDTMSENKPALALREYFTSSGLSPLASEWWHFNDFTAMRAAADNPSDGKYYMNECLSYAPG